MGQPDGSTWSYEADLTISLTLDPALHTDINLGETLVTAEEGPQGCPYSADHGCLETDDRGHIIGEWIGSDTFLAVGTTG